MLDNHHRLIGKPLSTRELQVLQLAADGRNAAYLSHVLGITQPTVRAHIRRILRKLEARNIAHAIHIAWLIGQFSLPPAPADDSEDRWDPTIEKLPLTCSPTLCP